MTTRTTQSCPGTTLMADGSRWHLHAVECRGPEHTAHETRLAQCLPDGHRCRQHLTTVEETTS